MSVLSTSSIEFKVLKGWLQVQLLLVILYSVKFFIVDHQPACCCVATVIHVVSQANQENQIVRFMSHAHAAVSKLE